MKEETRLSLTTIEELKKAAAAVAEQLKAAAAGAAGAPASGAGSRHRGLPEDLRRRFIDVRTALVQRGWYDPVLVRFDTASAPQATTAEIAERLSEVASSL
ncbi:MAG TPA: hypothetical protein VMS98_08765 [Thermoanaerobaculia bacterium]|nr:hypothetical protein [Thermoanaerobaculia bacterium]